MVHWVFYPRSPPNLIIDAYAITATCAATNTKGTANCHSQFHCPKSKISKVGFSLCDGWGHDHPGVCGFILYITEKCKILLEQQKL